MYSHEELQVKNQKKKKNGTLFLPLVRQFNARWTRTKLELSTRRKENDKTQKEGLSPQAWYGNTGSRLRCRGGGGSLCMGVILQPSLVKVFLLIIIFLCVFSFFFSRRHKMLLFACAIPLEKQQWQKKEGFFSLSPPQVCSSLGLF